MAWQPFFAGVSIYVLVSMVGEGIRPETAVEWVDSIVRMFSAVYLAQWIARIIGKAGQE